MEMEKFPYSRDVLQGVRAEWDVARVYTKTGDHDAAIELLEHVMSVPFELESVVTLRNFFWWDSLRNHPRFQALIEKYSKQQGI
jgi:hypothetical protein